MADTITFDPATFDDERSVVNDQTDGNQDDLSPTADDLGAFTTTAAFDDLEAATIAFASGGYSFDGAFADEVEAAQQLDAVTIIPSDQGSIDGVSVSIFPADGDSGWETLDGDPIMLQLFTHNGIDYLFGVVEDAVDGDRIAFASEIKFVESNGEIQVDLQLATFESLKHSGANEPADDLDLTGLVNLNVAESQVFSFVGTPSGKNLFTAIESGNGDSLLIVTPDSEILALNTSKGGGEITLGYANQMIDPGETLVFTYATPIAGFGDNYVPNLDQNEADLETNIEFQSLKYVDGGEVFVVQEQGNTPSAMTLDARTATSNGGDGFIEDVVDESTQVAIKEIVVNSSSGGTFALSDATETGTGSNIFELGDYRFVLNPDGTWTIGGFSSGDSIEYTTDGLHSTLLVTGASGKFDIGGIGINEPSSAVYDIGQHIVVRDDAPEFGAQADAPMLTTDDDVLGVSGANSGNFASIFTPDFGNDLEATSNGTSYALGISAPDVDSGLEDVVTGDAVLLSVNGDGSLITGYISSGLPTNSDDMVFTIAVDGAGLVTQTQFRAVSHTDANGGNDELPNEAIGLDISVTDLVSLTMTITDGDGDMKSDTADITSSFKFRDDNPTAGPAGIAQIDDDDVAGAMGNAMGDGDDDPSNVTGPLNYFFGNDGGSIAWSVDGAPDGFSYAVNPLNNRDLEIYQGTTKVITVSITGNTTDGFGYSVAQNAAIDHAPADKENNAVFNLSYIVTDGDDDKATGTLIVNADDDTPKITQGTSSAALETDDTDIPHTPDAVSFADLFNVSFGADGELSGGGTTYELGLGSNVSGLVDVESQQNVVLVLNADKSVISGYVAEAPQTVDNLVLTISVESNGDVSLAQYRAIDHSIANGGSNSDDDEAIGFVATDDLITLTATATDGDNDSVSLPVDITDRFMFRDDGPTAGNSGTAQLDDDDVDPLIGNPNGDGDDVPGNLTGALNYTFGNDGGAISWSGLGAPTGYSYNVNGSDLEILQGGIKVVTVSLTGTAEAGFGYSVVQNAAIDHAPGNAENNVEFTLNFIVTDGDNDTASGFLKVNVDDDTPEVEAAIDVAAVLQTGDATLGTDGPTSFAGLFDISYGADGAKAGGGATYKLFAKEGISTGLVDTVSKMDVLLDVNDAGTVVTGYIGSDSSDPLAQVFVISLNPANGDLTLDQKRSVVHDEDDDPVEANDPAKMNVDDLIELGVTATDGDDDDATLKVDITDKISFLDDGPVVSAGVGTALLQTDDSDLSPDTASGQSFAGLFAVDFGNDESKDQNDVAAVTYAMAVYLTGGSSGLKDSVSDQDVLLENSADGTTVTGYAMVDGAKETVFVATLNGTTGAIQLQQFRAIKHGDPGNDNESVTMSQNSYVKVTATAVDGDGDTHEFSRDVALTFEFFDDAPTIGGVDGEIPDQTGTDAIPLMDGAGTGPISLEGDGGGDTAKSYTITDYQGDGDGDNAAAIEVNGVVLATELVGPDSGGISTVYYYDEDGTTAGFQDGEDQLYFSLEVGPGNDGTGYYDFQVHYDPPPTFELFDFDDLPAGQNLFGMVGEGSDAIMLLGAETVLDGDNEFLKGTQTVNSSKGSEWSDTVVANTNNSFDRADEGLWIVYVADPVQDYLAGAPGGLDQNEADDADNMIAGDTREASKAFFQVAQTVGNSTASVTIEAWNLDEDSLQDGSGNFGGLPLVMVLDDAGSSLSDEKVSISSVRIYAAEDLRETSFGDLADPIYDSSTDTGEVNGIKVEIIGGVATITGLDSGMIVEWITDGDHDAALVTRQSGKYDIGFIGVAEANITDDENFEFTVEIEDFDGDTASDTFSIEVDGTDADMV